MNLQDQLKEKGWNLTLEGIDECSEGLENVNINAIIQKALDIDLREIGAKFLPDDINRGRIETITGPAVLQIQKIRNVSVPKLNSGYNNAPDLLKVQLTDGHTICNAVQWGNWKSISQDIPPGTKLCLKPGKIKIQNSFLVLTENQFTVLGGDVSALIAKWELSRSLACHIRATTGSDGGPPPWIPFGQHIDTNSLKNIRGNFRSLEQTQKEGKENEAFEQQRKANIAEIARAKEGKKKIFGGGKQILEGDSNASNTSYSYNKSTNSNSKNGISESVIVPSVHQAVIKNQAANRWENKTTTLKQEQNIKKREKTSQQSDSLVQSRPSGHSTLFDFLQTQISLPAEPNTSSDNGVSTTVSSSQSTCTKESNTTYRNVPQLQHGKEKFEKYKKNGQNSYQEQRTNSKKTNYISRESENFHVSQPNNDKPNDKGTGKLNDNHIKNNSRNFRDIDKMRNRNCEKNIGNESKSHYLEGRNLHTKPNKGRYYCDDNESFSDKKNWTDSYNDQKFYSSTSVPYKHNEQEFIPKEGNRVLAKYWEDNKLYPAVVHAVSSNGATCVVHFVDYGNYEEVLTQDVKPLESDWNYNQSNGKSANSFPNGMLQQNFVGTLEFRRGGNKPYVHTDTVDNSSQGLKRGEGSSRPSRQLYQPPAQRRHVVP